MPSEIQAFVVTIPALTSQATPVTIDVSFNPMTVEAIHWRVPPGHVGLTGWQLTEGGAQVIPKNAGQYVIADGESGVWELEDLHDSGSWQVTAYNLGNQPHSIYLRFLTSPITKRDTTPMLLDTRQLASAPDLSRAGPPVRGR